MITIRQLLSEAMVGIGMDPDQIVRDLEPLAQALVRSLRYHNLAIHEDAYCARLPREELGRPMDPAEQELASAQPPLPRRRR